MGIRFVHTADVHLGMSFNKASFGLEKGIQRRHEVKATFFELLHLCEAEAIDLLLIAGDLFDNTYVSISDLKDIRNRFEQMPATTIMIIAGNHDAMVDSKCGYALMDWPSHVHLFGPEMSKVTIDHLNLDVYGMSWHTKTMKSYNFEDLVIEDPNKTNVLMLHGDIYHETTAYLPIPKWVLTDKGFDYVALGHVHQPDFSQSQYAYPGSLEPFDFSEKGARGVLVGILDDTGVHLTFRPMCQRQFIQTQVTVYPENSYEDIKNRVMETLRNFGQQQHFYRVQLTGMKDEHVYLDMHAIEEVAQGQVHYCELVDQTVDNYDLERLKNDYQDSIIHRFIVHMESLGTDQPQVQQALYEGLHILLKA